MDEINPVRRPENMFCILPDKIHCKLRIENTIYDTWMPEEQELFMKLNCGFAEKLRDKIKELIESGAALRQDKTKRGDGDGCGYNSSNQ